MYGIDPWAVQGWRRFAMRSFASAVVLAALVVTGLCSTSRAAAAATPTAGAHTVTYDGYSFMVDGQRTYLWSGEFHYFRLPEPRPVARHLPEDEGRRVQRHLAVLRLGLPLAASRGL